MNNNLYVNHKLNYDEAVRRLKYWLDNQQDWNRRDGALKTLVSSLERSRDNLYFEEQQDKDEVMQPY
jgi:hypothetical protein